MIHKAFCILSDKSLWDSSSTSSVAFGLCSSVFCFGVLHDLSPKLIFVVVGVVVEIVSFHPSRTILDFANLPITLGLYGFISEAIL